MIRWHLCGLNEYCWSSDSVRFDNSISYIALCSLFAISPFVCEKPHKRPFTKSIIPTTEPLNWNQNVQTIQCKCKSVQSEKKERKFSIFIPEPRELKRFGKFNEFLNFHLHQQIRQWQHKALWTMLTQMQNAFSAGQQFIENRDVVWQTKNVSWTCGWECIENTHTHIHEQITLLRSGKAAYFTSIADATNNAHKPITTEICLCCCWDECYQSSWARSVLIKHTKLLHFKHSPMAEGGYAYERARE